MLTYVGSNSSWMMIRKKKKTFQWKSRIPYLSRPCTGKFDASFLALPKSLGLVDKTNAVHRDKRIPLPHAPSCKPAPVTGNERNREVKTGSS